MTADAVIMLVLPRHHGHGVPPDDALDAPLQRAIAGIGDFILGRNGVDVVGGEAERKINSGPFGTIGKLFQEKGSPVGSNFIQDLIQGLDPFRCFARIGVIHTFSELLVHGVGSSLL